MSLVVIVIVTAFFNVNIALDDNVKKVCLSLVDAEALADNNEWNNWSEWLTQGFTKDESERSVECQSGNNTTGVGGYIETWVMVDGVPVKVKVAVNAGTSSPAGKSKITCGYGSENCTPTNC